MNKLKLSFLSFSLCFAFLCCGCSDQSTKHAETLPKITIASEVYPPFIYTDSNGELSGIDADLAREACKRLHYQAVFTTIDWTEKDSLLESGDVDCIWGCFSMTGREKDYQWAGPYMVNRQVVAVNQNSNISQLSDLAGKTVSVQTNSRAEEIFLAGTDARIPAVADVISTDERGIQFAALDCGYVDAAAAYETSIVQYMQNCDVSFRILEEPLLTTGLGVAFAKDDDRGLAEKLNQTLNQMRKDGTMEKMIHRYLDHSDAYLEVDSLEKN